VPYPTTTRRFSTLFLASLSHAILKAAKNPVAAEAAQSLIQGAAPGLPQHPARTLRRNTCRGAIYRAQDPPPPLHCKLKVSLASNVGTQASARNAAS
jgi:hypothetical protein